MFVERARCSARENDFHRRFIDIDVFEFPLNCSAEVARPRSLQFKGVSKASMSIKCLRESFFDGLKQPGAI